MRKITRILLIAALFAFAAVILVPHAHAINNPPYWNQIPGQTVSAGEQLIFSVSASDPDGGLLTYSALNLPPGAYFSSTFMYFSWRPTTNQGGNYSVTFRAFDGLSTTDMSVPIYVIGAQNQSNTSPYPYIPPYQPPFYGQVTFSGFNPPLIAVEGELYSYDVQAFSTTGNQITYTLPVAPAGMSINPSTGLITWVPTYSQGRSLPYQVTVQASNGNGTAVQSYNVTVLQGSIGGDVPPTTIPQARLTISDISVKINDANEVVVSWKTNLSATARVIYDTVSEAERTEDFTYEFASDETTNPSTTHTIILKDVEPDTTYFFRAVAKRNGVTVVSDESSLRTAVGATASVFAALGAFLASPWFLIPVILILAFLIIRSRKGEGGH